MFRLYVPAHTADPHIIAGPSLGVADPSENVAGSGEVAQNHPIKSHNGHNVASEVPALRDLAEILRILSF